MIEIFTDKIFSSHIPPTLHQICQPGPVVWRVTGYGDEGSISHIEDIAKVRTAKYPDLGNDIGRENMQMNPVARITHVLEHLVVLRFLDIGRISISELDVGNSNLAFTVGGTTPSGDHSAAFWLKAGLVEEDEVDTLLLNLSRLFS